MLSREEMLAAHKTAPVKTHIPAWNGDIWIRMLSTAEGTALSDALKANTDSNMRFAVNVAAFIGDEHGVPLFTAQEALREFIQQGHMKAVQEIIEAGLRQNGLLSPETVKGN